MPNGIDAIVAPTDNPPWLTDLIVGYPIIKVPMGFSFGVPVGISSFASAFSEPTLIKLASGFEAVTHARQAPQFLSTLPFKTTGEPTRDHRRHLLPRTVPSFM